MRKRTFLVLKIGDLFLQGNQGKLSEKAKVCLFSVFSNAATHLCVSCMLLHVSIFPKTSTSCLAHDYVFYAKNYFSKQNSSLQVIAEIKLMELMQTKLHPHSSQKPLKCICIFTKEACQPNELLMGRILEVHSNSCLVHHQAIHP